MFNETEEAEKGYLRNVLSTLRNGLRQIDEQVNEYAKEVQDSKTYLWENKAGMDHAEKVSVRESVTKSALIGEAAVAKKVRIRKLMASPYFGRIDFQEKEKNSHFPIYIGIHSYLDEESNQNLIHDWRAPISGMFYDFELGDAAFDSPNGEITGEIKLKRQYRIRNSEWEFMLESSVNIHDDILQKELSRSADDRMKNIVATIQRDQNAIIRNEISRELLIQGVAGSGKTSIALHRIAFLLYRFKDNIQSKDILIISPNKVFADYISNVLPELGEEKVPEKGIEELANEILDHKFKFQTFFEQVSLLLEGKKEAFEKRIRFKSSLEFLASLDTYLTHIENQYFEPVDLVVRRYPVPQWFIKERFEAYHRLPLFKRFVPIVEDIEENLRIFYKYEIDGQERNKLRAEVRKMFKITTLRNLYKDFYHWLGKKELFKTQKGSLLEYADVYPLIYLKIRLEGIAVDHRVKHLLVDEMQDYTPVQYAVLSRVFPCKKTILGDANQSVNPFSSTDVNTIQKVFPGSKKVLLNKSYRSTFEITMFAQNIAINPDIEPVIRHGEQPEVLSFKDEAREIDKIKILLQDFLKSDHNTFGIICKTQKQAEKVFNYIKSTGISIHLITENSGSFGDGIVLTTCHLAKGLEFDQVVIPFVSQNNYQNEMDKSMLYIACTRAMHLLTLTYSGEKSRFI
ncbi:MAG: UvrD-helicase domain-containing protein [Cyclobacteriaceae bacterium]